jgi:hypothetical protein
LWARQGGGKRRVVYSPALPRLLRSRRIKCVAALPYSTLPIHSGSEPDAVAERRTGSQAPRHSGHTGLKHRRRFDDDGGNRRPPGRAASLPVVKGGKPQLGPSPAPPSISSIAHKFVTAKRPAGRSLSCSGLILADQGALSISLCISIYFFLGLPRIAHFLASYDFAIPIILLRAFPLVWRCNPRNLECCKSTFLDC